MTRSELLRYNVSAARRMNEMRGSGQHSEMKNRKSEQASVANDRHQLGETNRGAGKRDAQDSASN